MSRSLPRHLRVLRAERGLTMTAAAEGIGVTVETLGELERGKRRPYMPTISKIAKFYDVSVEELVEEAEAAVVGKAEGSEETAGPEQLHEGAGDIRSQEAFGQPELVNIGEEVEKLDRAHLVGEGLVLVSVDEDRLEWVLLGVKDGRLTIPEAKDLLKRGTPVR